MRCAPTKNTVFSHQPFIGQGVSLYVSIGTAVRYRRLAAMCGHMVHGAEIDFSSGPVAKTARIDSAASPVTSITPAWNSDWEDETVSVDIRTYKDGVENESTNWRTIDIDGTGDSPATISGTAVLLGLQQRDGGIVRIRFAWQPAFTGLQADTFTAIRTAGPTSPADVEYVAGTGRQLIEIDTPALSDASPYTYKIQAASGATTLDILTGITVTADATGPTAPTGLSAEAW